MHLPKCMVKGSLGELNTGDPYVYVKHLMDGSKEIKYHVNLIDMLDRVFIDNGMKFTSPRQERFLNKFFNEAGKVTDKLNSGQSDAFKTMDTVFRQLDDFLGSYRGVDNGRYTR